MKNACGADSPHDGSSGLSRLGTGLSCRNAETPACNFVSANAASEAFDEPLTKAQVVAIMQPFFIPTIPA